MAIKERTRPVDASKIVIERVEPGAFYQHTQPGHYTSPVTGIRIPGPIVTIDSMTNQVNGVGEMPDPVQIPTHKVSFDLKEKDQEVECAFDRIDAEGTCDDLNLALQTGVIRRVPDEKMQELYPDVWARRKERIVWAPNKPTKPTAEFIDDFEHAPDFQKARAAAKQRQRIAEESAARGEGVDQTSTAALKAPPSTNRRGRPPRPQGEPEAEHTEA